MVIKDSSDATPENWARDRLYTMLEVSGEGFVFLDREEKLEVVSRRTLELWRKPESTVLGRRLRDIFPGIEHGDLYKSIQFAIKSQQVIRTEAVSYLVGGRWVEQTVYPMPDGAVAVTFRDIHEARVASLALRASELRLARILATTPVAIVEGDVTGRITYSNPMADQLRSTTGYSLQALGYTLIGTDQTGPTSQALAGHQVRDAEITLNAAKTGLSVTLSVNADPITDDTGAVTGFTAAFADVSARHRAEAALWRLNETLEQRVLERTDALAAANQALATEIEERARAEADLRRAQRLESLGQLTSGIAHDFNNLLTAIIGNLELLGRRNSTLARPQPERRRVENAEQRLVENALRAAERGANLTAQLLAFSRQQPFQPCVVDLNALIVEMVTLLSTTLGSGITLETQLEANLGPALTDPTQFELVILNLVLNARDAMNSGGVITLATKAVTKPAGSRAEAPPAGDYVEVSVSDTGTGITASVLDRVFEPFFTTKEPGKGSGLGLSQVLGLVKQCGGGVEIDTRPGAGTTMRVFVPRPPIGMQALVQNPALPSVPAPRGPSKVRVLLVDDDHAVRLTTSALLTESGCLVVEAGNGAEAEALLRAAPDSADIAILDNAMPGMAGTELARILRQVNPALPIIFITGYADTALRRDAQSLGQILQKPFQSDALIAAMHQGLAQIKSCEPRFPHRDEPFADNPSR